MSFAQKKDIAQARAYVKAGNNLEKAEQMMKKLLNDSANRHNEKIWNTLFSAVRVQYEQGNEKLYLKQKYDTTKLFVLNKRMFEILESFDSIDATPNSKGIVKLKYRDKNAEYLNQYRPNLFNGGVFFLNKQNYEDAYNMFASYIDCVYQPLFSSYDYLNNDSRLNEAAYWTLFCGYKLNDNKATLRFLPLALKDSLHYAYTLQYMSETYKNQNDTTKYVETLKEGFSKYHNIQFFFTRLVDFYLHNDDTKTAINIVEKALDNDSTNAVFLFAKSTILLNMGKYDECISISDSLLANNDSLVDAYFNAGIAYFNKSIELDKRLRVTNSQRKQIHSYYKKSLSYLTKYRELAPDQKNKWCFPLYTIYLNLNMGKEFDEIDKLMNSEKK